MWQLAATSNTRSAITDLSLTDVLRVMVGDRFPGPFEDAECMRDCIGRQGSFAAARSKEFLKSSAALANGLAACCEDVAPPFRCGCPFLGGYAASP